MSIRLFWCALAAAFCVEASPGEEPNKATQEEWKRLDGEWRIVKTEIDGKVVESKTNVTFAAGQCTISAPCSGIPDIKTTIAIDPSQKPKWMDVTNDQMKTHKGIYELDGDKLKAVFRGDPKGERPTELKPVKGTVMYTYERVKSK